jgi:phospholipase C
LCPSGGSIRYDPPQPRGTDTCTNPMCANPTYDLTYFYRALAAGNLPAVTYLKFTENDTGHPSDSTPLEEQTQIVDAVNAIQQSPFWQDTAIVITYDDSDGWYDHVRARGQFNGSLVAWTQATRVPRA